MYEGIRLAQETDAGRTHAKLTTLRRRIEMVRVPIAKQEIANDQRIKNPITLVRVGTGDRLTPRKTPLPIIRRSCGRTRARN
jgi:hypothetical protein